MLPTALKFPLVLMLVFCAQSQASRSLQTTESGQDEFSLAEQRETLCAFEKQGFLTELAQETANATVEAIRGDKGNDFADYMLSRMTVFHYIAARALQYAVPLFVGIALIFIALPIALVVLYARPHGKVRRVLCFCCERKIEDLQYKPIKMWEKITIWVFYATCFCGFVFMSVFALAWALNVTDGLQEASCTCFTYAEQILYGTNVSGTEADPDKPFIGLLPAVEALESLHNKLDPDSPDSIAHEIRDIVSDTSPFYDAFSNFRGDLQLMIDNFDNPRNNLIKQKDSFYHGFHRNIMCEVLVDPLNEAIRLTSEGFYDAMAQLHAQLENLLAKGEEGLRNVAAGLKAFSGEDTKKEFLVIAESMANSIHQLFLPLSFAFFIILVIITSAGLLGIFAGVALLVIVEISFWRAKRRHAIIRASRESAQQRRRSIEDPQAAYVERSPMKGKGYTPVKRRDSNESEKEKETEVGTLNRQNSANFLDRNKSELTAPDRSFEEDGGDAREREERAQKVDPLSLPIPTKIGSVTPLMNGEKKKPEVKKKGSGESGRAKDMEEGNLGMQGGLSPGGQSQRDARNRRDLVEHFEIFDELAMIEETRGLSDVDIVYWNPRRSVGVFIWGPLSS
uniref:Uncharacterized protein n=1 Tax=Chromera velia CCMP2878 TaxID=1169474 RepID=A0A0G4ICU9_9ALVE|eukprot:Cvel_13152.t1-p1 / transcript=Cvel_13152.t1 / gene=Cvel_13152 / organism=Chromera_velia_CCMP2878 / gene_product=hypothetical protein / transcript_product=hypothetical protein / location=Cvel_scaffold887:57647-62501(+) / protein_length=622 / sequence_SO=supercontig / SO=protein_coding / is_pseudo=false